MEPYSKREVKVGNRVAVGLWLFSAGLVLAMLAGCASVNRDNAQVLLDAMRELNARGAAQIDDPELVFGLRNSTEVYMRLEGAAAQGSGYTEKPGAPAAVVEPVKPTEPEPPETAVDETIPIQPD